MINILSFFAIYEKTSEMTTISTDFSKYIYTKIENGRVVNEKTTKSLVVATSYYQVDLELAIEQKKQIIIL